MNKIMCLEFLLLINGNVIFEQISVSPFLNISRAQLLFLTIKFPSSGKVAFKLCYLQFQLSRVCLALLSGSYCIQIQSLQDLFQLFNFKNSSTPTPTPPPAPTYWSSMLAVSAFLPHILKLSSMFALHLRSWV